MSPVPVGPVAVLPQQRHLVSQHEHWPEQAENITFTETSKPLLGSCSVVTAGAGNRSARSHYVGMYTSSSQQLVGSCPHKSIGEVCIESTGFGSYRTQDALIVH